jgi:hypothetical protein
MPSGTIENQDGKNTAGLPINIHIQGTTSETLFVLKPYPQGYGFFIKRSLGLS